MKRRNALIVFVLIVLVILVLDRFTKIIAIEHLTDSGPIAFLPLFLDFVLVYNTGGAFGMFEGGATVFVVVAVIAVIVIIGYLLMVKKPHLPIVIALSFIAGGALGNAYDRALYGAVPDFIHTIFIDFPVFNVADMALTVGEIGLLIAVAIYWFALGREKDEDEELIKGALTNDEELVQHERELLVESKEIFEDEEEPVVHKQLELDQDANV